MLDRDQLDRLTTASDQASAAALLPRAEAALRPADRTWLTSQVSGLFGLFPMQDVPKQALQGAILAYVEDLAEYPQDIAAVALRDARRGAQTFRPSIKDIRDIAEPLIRDRRGQVAGLRRVAQRKPEPIDMPAPNEAQKAAVEEIMAKWRTGQRV